MNLESTCAQVCIGYGQLTCMDAKQPSRCASFALWSRHAASIAQPRRPACPPAAQDVTDDQGSKVGTVLQLRVLITCSNQYVNCCADSFYGAHARITFFVPAGGGADQAEAVDFEV